MAEDPQLGENGPIRIWMNHPWWYQGETFYQSGMITDPRTGAKTTDLQVVRNMAWTFPYFACGMVALGMAFHFLLRLVTFLPKRVAKVRSSRPTVDKFERFFPLAVVVLTAFYLVGKAMPPSAKPDRLDLYGFGQIPVQHGGRVQPADSVARNSLMVISGKSEYVEEIDRSHERTYPATEWLVTLWGDPDKADKFKIFRADHPQVLSLMGLPQRPGSYRYSMAELEPGLGKLEAQAKTVLKKDKDKRDSYDQRVLQLTEHVRVYRDLKDRVVPGFIPTEDPAVKWLSRREILEQLAPEIVPAAQKKAKEQVAEEMKNNPNFLPGLVEKYIGGMAELEKAAQQMGGRQAVVEELVKEETGARMRKIAAEMLREQEPAAFPPEGVMQTMFTAYQKDKPTDFNAALAEYRDKHTGLVSETDKSKVGARIPDELLRPVPPVRGPVHRRGASWPR